MPSRLMPVSRTDVFGWNRGFADSSSSPPPSEEGVLIDARRAFDYLHVDHDVDPSQIAIMGQSLGTGIATALAARLEAQGPFVRARPARSRTAMESVG